MAQIEVIHLVLFSDTEPYRSMRQETKAYYRSFRPWVHTYYYMYEPDLQNEWELRDEDLLCFRGSETYLPGILRKTLLALYFALDAHPDAQYIIRSNASTVVNLPLLREVFSSNPTLWYGGSYIFKLEWLDPRCNIVDLTYWGTSYVSGTGILLSRAAAVTLRSNENDIPLDIIDDVAIGVFFARRYHRLPQLVGKVVGVGNAHYDCYDSCFYRCKNTNDRQHDIETIHEICQRLARSVR